AGAPDGEEAVVIGIVMGSTSDWETMKAAAKVLEEFGVPYEAKAMSAHRTPHAVAEWAAGAQKSGKKAIIAAAGGAAHLAGVVADASSEKAMRRLYAVKGRPADHPVIVHFASTSEAFKWGEATREATLLAERFWPGPLTMILKRSELAKDFVTGGQPSVGIRVPSHPVARELLKEFGRPIAAPSANRFGRVSPTTAAHVREDLGADVDLVLEGGPSEVGIESTIVDLSGGAAALLRPGKISKDDLQKI